MEAISLIHTFRKRLCNNEAHISTRATHYLMRIQITTDNRTIYLSFCYSLSQNVDVEPARLAR